VEHEGCASSREKSWRLQRVWLECGVQEVGEERGGQAGEGPPVSAE
jgi:hypothetical protein